MELSKKHMQRGISIIRRNAHAIDSFLLNKQGGNFKVIALYCTFKSTTKFRTRRIEINLENESLD